MPSFATLLIAATAALAGFTAAAPVGDGTPFGDLLHVGDVAGNTLGGNTKRQADTVGDITDSTGSFDDIFAGFGKTKRQGNALDAVAGRLEQSTTDSAAHIPGGLTKRKEPIPPSESRPTTTATPHSKRCDGCRSLPETLLAVKADLLVVLGDCKDIIAADANVDVKVFVPILKRVGAILAAAVIEIKALAGKSIEIVLFLGGSVISVVDCAKILANVLIIVYSILAIVIQVAGSVNAEVIVSLVAVVSGCVGELLVAAFIAVDGLLVALIPLIDVVINLSHVWAFADILAILKV